MKIYIFNERLEGQYGQLISESKKAFSKRSYAVRYMNEWMSRLASRFDAGDPYHPESNEEAWKFLYETEDGLASATVWIDEIELDGEWWTGEMVEWEHIAENYYPEYFKELYDESDIDEKIELKQAALTEAEYIISDFVDGDINYYPGSWDRAREIALQYLDIVGYTTNESEIPDWLMNDLARCDENYGKPKSEYGI